MGQGCNFFKWAEDVDSNAPSNSNPPPPPPPRPQTQLQNTGNQDGDLVCRCGSASLLKTVRKEGPNQGKIYFLPGIFKIKFLTQDVNFGVAALAMTADFSNGQTKLQLLLTRTLVQVVDTILTCLLFLLQDHNLSQQDLSSLLWTI
jgi:GRF zinc finger